MARVKGGPATRRRRKRLLKRAEGNYGARRKHYKTAKATVERGQAYAYEGRKQKKRQFRQLWIIRINAAAREHGLSYSRLINGLNKAEIAVDRKMLALLAVEDKAGFAAIAEKAKSALA